MGLFLRFQLNPSPRCSTTPTTACPRVAFGVRAEVDFGREAAARAAERLLLLIPPFTPAACWCARTIVEIDGMLLVGRRPKRSQYLEGCVPNPKLAPAGKAHENRVPIAVSPWHVTPRRAGAQDPKDAVDRSPFALYRRATLAAIGEKGIENAPFRVRQIASTQCRLPKKGSLGIIYL